MSGYTAMATFLEGLDEGWIWGDARPPSSLDRLTLARDSAQVREFHQTWIQAGAKLIRACSAGVHEFAAESKPWASHLESINWHAARGAADVASSTSAWALAVITPSGFEAERIRTAHRRLIDGFKRQLGALLDGGCQAVLFQGFQNGREAGLAVEALRNLHHCPAVVLGNPNHFDFSAAVGEGADALGWVEVKDLNQAQSLAEALPPTQQLPLALEAATGCWVNLASQQARLTELGFYCLFGQQEVTASQLTRILEKQPPSEA